MSHTNDLPTSVPADVVIGETLEWEKDLADFPADEWSVTYYFRGAGPGFNVTGEADDLVHQFVVASETSGTMVAGRYDYQAIAEKDGEKHLVDEGVVTAKASLASLEIDETHDGRSKAKKILDAIDDLMQGKAQLDQQKFLIASGVPGFTSQHEAERIQPTELLELRKYYAKLVNAEIRAKKRNPFQTIKVQFNPPSRKTKWKS